MNGEKKLDDEKLAEVTGGVDTDTPEGKEKFQQFLTNFPKKNCMFCAKLGRNCPYGGSVSARYDAFNGDPNAVCPERA